MPKGSVCSSLWPVGSGRGSGRLRRGIGCLKRLLTLHDEGQTGVAYIMGGNVNEGYQYGKVIRCWLVSCSQLFKFES